MSKDGLAQKRIQMVREQLEARGINNRNIIETMRRVPRHLFITGKLQEFAYEDAAQPIGESQTISQPYIVAHMLQELELEPTFKVLEIGTGSGYQAAILAELVKDVYTVEINPLLAKDAHTKLEAQGYTNIHYKIADGCEGWKEAAPFDAIVVSAAPPKIPRDLVKQLKIGGKMILPLGDVDQVLVVLEKNEEGLTSKETLGVAFVPMVGKIAEES